MADVMDRVQGLMDEFYNEWRKEENRDKDKWALLEGFSEAHQIAVAFGNFNYQVENGGLEQWVYNGYFHDDAEKFTEYLEIGAAIDDRCQIILGRVNLLEQYAADTECDREGYYRDEDGDSQFIGDLMDCGKFDTWYYDRCGKDDWWQTVSGIIDKAEGRDLPPAVRDNPAPEKAAAPVAEATRNNSPIQVYIENASDSRVGGFTIPLPTNKETLTPWLTAIEVTGDHQKDIAIREIKSPMPELLKALRHGDHPLDELNYLAAKVGGLDGEHREMFLAALETGEYNGDIGKIINLTENLDLFYLAPAYSPEQYGEFLLDQAETEHLDALSHLETSGDPENIALARYILKLEAHIDKAAYGRSAAEAEHGTFTEHGYLTEFGEFRDAYRGPQDIPQEYRLLTDADARDVAVDADLTSFVLKAHALGGDFMADAPRNLNTLEARRSAEYLMTVTDQSIFVTETAHVYREGSDAYNTVMAAVEKDGARAFALHVTDMHGEHVAGDIAALDVGTLGNGALEVDILSNAIRFTHVDATTKSGEAQTFTPDQWAAMEPIDRDQLQSWTRHFDSADQQAVLRHLEEVRDTHAASGKVVGSDELLAKLNADYMASAECSRPDMLRITLPAAKEMLTHGDAQVYRLLPEGPKELSPLDAMQSRGGLWYQQHREFAVKRGDIGSLDKWAGREAKAIYVQRQPERETPEKPKSRGPEL